MPTPRTMARWRTVFIELRSLTCASDRPPRGVRIRTTRVANGHRGRPAGRGGRIYQRVTTAARGPRLARRSHRPGRMTHLLADLRLAARSLARAPLFTFVAVVSIALGIGANTAVFTLARPGGAAAAAGPAARRAGPDPRPRRGELRRRHRATAPSCRGRCSAISRTRPPGFDGVVGRVSRRCTSATRAAASAPTASWSRATSSRCSASSPRAGPRSSRRPTTHAGRAPAGGARLRLLAPALPRPRRRPRPGGPINGHPFTVIGVAAAGLLRPRARRAERRLRAGDDAAAARPGMAEDRRPALPLGPGLRAAAARARRRAGAGRAAAALQRDPPDGSAGARLPARLGRDRRRSSSPREVHVVDGATARPAARAAGAVADDPDGRRRRRAADRLRQRRQPADRPRRRARARAGAARGRSAPAAPGAGCWSPKPGPRRRRQRVRPVLATWGAGCCGRLLDLRRARRRDASPDCAIVAFTTAIAIPTALLVRALAPALRAAKAACRPPSKAAGGGVVREQPRLRKTLVVAQVALSFLMLVTAGLFVRSLDNLLRVHPGFATAQVTSFTVDLERSGYEDARSQPSPQPCSSGCGAAGRRRRRFRHVRHPGGRRLGHGLHRRGLSPKPGEAPARW